MTKQKLLDLKDQVEEAKEKVSELKGQQNALSKQLKDDWDCSSVANAEIKLKSMEAAITLLDKKIERSVKELEEKYNIE